MAADLSYFEKLDPARRAIAEALHAKIAVMGPGLTQKPRWGVPAFLGKRDIVSVSGMGKGGSVHVNLQFFFGARLPKPHGLIEGTGKNMRHIRFHTLDDVNRPAVEDAIAAAIAYDGSH